MDVSHGFKYELLHFSGRLGSRHNFYDDHSNAGSGSGILHQMEEKALVSFTTSDKVP